MEVVIGLVAAVLIGLGSATGVMAAITANSDPDKSVNFTDVHSPQPWAGVPDYGK